MREGPCRRPRSTFLILLALACLGSDRSPNLLFYASFDRGASAEYAAGRREPYIGDRQDPLPGLGHAKQLPGAFGLGITHVPGSFEALGNILPERGTVAFFAKLTGPDRHADPFQVRTLDWYYWHTYLRISREAESLAAAVADEAFALDLGAKGPPGDRLTHDRWRHLAIVWDQAYGLILYLDGKRVRSTWGERSWLSRGVDPAQPMLAWSDGAIAYDELYIFDQPLDDEQIRTLARYNRPPAGDALPDIDFDPRRRANRLRELGLDASGSAPVRVALDERGHGALTVRQIAPSDARALKAEAGSVLDGKLGQGWPLPWRYEFNGGNGLSVELPEAFDVAVLEGRFRGRAYAGRHLSEPDAVPLHTFDPRAYRTRWRPREPQSGWLTFFRSGSERESQIAELSFFRTGSPEPAHSTLTRRFLATEIDAQNRRLLQIDVDGRYGPGDRERFGTAHAPVKRHRTLLPALRFHHLILPPREGDWGLRAVRLLLQLRGQLQRLPLRVEVRDPLHASRRLAAFDLELDAAPQLDAGRVELILDLGARIIAARKPLWILMVAGRDVELEFGSPDGSYIELLESSAASLAGEFAERELPVVRSLFRQLSEERPWVSHEHPEVTLAAFNPAAREVFGPLELLRRLLPAHPRVAALWLWTHPRTEQSGSPEPAPVAGHAEAPRWALWQRELYRRGAAVLHWWIENRQVPSGEFGDDWNDDTDLIQNVPALALLADRGERLRASARAVADGVYSAGRIRNGLNSRLSDPLHAYEEGMNAQQVMALLEPGAPEYLERLMDSARSIDEKLMREYAPGRRSFRSSRFSTEQVLEGAWERDSVRHSILLAPALSVAYYNHNPRAIRMVGQWVDGWLDLYPRARPAKNAGPLFATVRMPGGRVLEYDWRPRGWGYVSLFPALYALTGEARYREVMRYWTGEFDGGAFLEHVPEIHHALELLDPGVRREALMRWSRTADLGQIGSDDLGDAARRRILETELDGDPEAAVQALAASVYRLRALHEAFTWAEPIADRIWLPTEPLAVMSQGGLSHERNQLWPEHHVSYEGFSDLAAWVREKTETRLRIYLYSFAPHSEKGSIRLWRLAPGRYRIRSGADPDGDGRPDQARWEERQLQRFDLLPLELEPGRVIALELEGLNPPPATKPLPDLALSARWTGADGPLEVTLHNLGEAPAENAMVRLLDASGAQIAERRVASIEPPTDLRPRRVELHFPEARRSRTHVLRVDPGNSILELNETNNEVYIQP